MVGVGVVNGSVGAGLSELNSEGKHGRTAGPWLLGMGVGAEQGQGHHWVCCLFNLPSNLVWGGSDMSLPGWEPLLPEVWGPPPPSTEPHSLTSSIN